ncbi:uncharacterized protein EI97DRAFT_465798 [Westerdykella ornata]|uniref:Uncharacterized protein n=1 Tax=Westerdykella ornata TaxID=318751 RepID=A0A6A6JQ62_WESOR|nr:uncharacterized protein EI97DRAFT_465798 [Westerdykella ornata]KAF2278517.1 hypothetical protein EI97DRAFT_465798 [Westerdykella ornata]
MAAPQSEREVNGAGKGDVSSCVTNLIHAFTNGLDIFKRLRERPRKRKARKQDQVEEISNDEMQLSNSLRKGPQDIGSCYSSHYGKAGDRFAKGDPIAHASLAETLIKLNTGLVNIIATFLNHDRKSDHLNLDYKSLTRLSNASRAEAIDSLNQLYQRLSQSQLQLSHQGRRCSHCGTVTISKHQDCCRRSGHDRLGARSDKKSRTSSPTRSNGPTVARVPIKSSSQTQLVIIRPRNPRKNSAGSTTSHASASSAVKPSALPHSNRKDPSRPPNTAIPTPRAVGRRRSSSADGSRPTTRPQPKHDTTLRLQVPAANPPPKPAPSIQKEAMPSSTMKRRAEKVTPSTFTFASDSTILGEIPERNWIQPFDYAEAERLNAEALANWVPATGGERVKPKKGLFGFLRRGTAVAS